MQTNYRRIIPRDLFNEANLLKCVGRLILLIQEDQIPLPIIYNEDCSEGFKIRMLPCGDLTISNIEFFINKEQVIFKTTYNAKGNYPLFCEWDDCEFLVFDEQGQFTEEFIECAKMI
jgi:hypothetical protein